MLYFSVAQMFVVFFISIYREKMKKKFPLAWFHLPFNTLIFFKVTFPEKYDRYKTETFRVDYLDYELLILIETDNILPYHGKLVN